MSATVITCIHERNPLGGFARQHRRLCCLCDLDAEAHVNVGPTWCGNLCREHTKRYQATRKDVIVTEGLRGLDEENEE